MPRENVPVWSVPLPPGAEPPIEVYVNGERRAPEADYTIEGRWVRFTTPLKPQPPLGFRHRLMLAIGIGVYGDMKGDVIDVSFHRNGRPDLASGLPIMPPSTAYDV